MIDEENPTENGEDQTKVGDSAPDAGDSRLAGEEAIEEGPGEVAELELALAQTRDQLLRRAAEFDNYKKRMEAETGAVIRFANEDLLLRLLPVLDDFERSFKALGKTPPGSPGSPASPAPEASPQQEAFVTGIELIYGKFRKVMEQAGLTPFDSAGHPFNPELHDALLQVPRDDVPHHTVVEEVEKGYRLNEKVLRHARVVVSSNSASASS
jgi:molecular chaperone GrpE